jgi:hypothetical protein
VTSRDRLDLARLRREPTHVIARLEHAVACEEALHVADPAPVWPWLLLALAAGIVAGATLIPHAEPIAQVVDAGGEE